MSYSVELRSQSRPIRSGLAHVKAHELEGDQIQKISHNYPHSLSLLPSELLWDHLTAQHKQRNTFQKEDRRVAQKPPEKPSNQVVSSQSVTFAMHVRAGVNGS